MADFLNKIKICENETSETVYWLESIYDLDIADTGLLKLILAKSCEILAIFTSIGKKIKLYVL